MRWKQMADGEEKRAAFLREMEPFLREMNPPSDPAPASKVAWRTKVVVGATFLLLMGIVVRWIL
jgi:hypothetical protein